MCIYTSYINININININIYIYVYIIYEYIYISTDINNIITCTYIVMMIIMDDSILRNLASN